jgi:hypothetical protein
MKKRFSLIGLLLAGVVGTAHMQEEPTIPPLRDAGNLALVYHIPEMEEVEVETDISYSSESPDHLLDVYLPPETEESLPVVLLTHGGAPAEAHFKDTAGYQSWGRLIAASGMAGVTFNWNSPNTEDLDTLMDYLRQNADDLKLDMERVCIMAYSAGVDASLVWSAQAEGIRCFVGYYGGYTDSLDYLISDEAITLLPTLLLHGTRDEALPLVLVRAFVNEAEEREQPVELLVHSVGVHAFDLRNDDDESRELIQASVAFLQEQLLGE